MDNKKIGMILVVSGAIIICIAIILLISKKQSYTEKTNSELNSEQLQILIKEITNTLSASENINEPVDCTVDEMVSFAFSYTSYFDNENLYTSIDEDNAVGIISIDAVKEKINYLFGINKFKLSDLTYEVKDNKIYVPLNLHGRDSQIYKYVDTVYNEKTGEYIATIDCLEASSTEDMSNLLEKSKYNKDDVIYTLQIKYKVVEGRRVLLAYSGYANLEY